MLLLINYILGILKNIFGIFAALWDDFEWMQLLLRRIWILRRAASSLGCAF